MSHENVEAVRSIYERWGAGDFSAGVELFDEEAVLTLRPEFPDAGEYSGIDAIRKYTRGLLSAWEHLTIEAEEITAVGDRVVVALRQAGVGRSSGVATELRYFQVWSFRGDRVVRIENCRERDEAVEAARNG